MREGLLVDGEPARRVALLRALPGVGDFLCATPAWRALKAALPGSEMVLVGPAVLEPLVARCPSVDRLLPFPGYPGLPEGDGRPSQVTEFLAEAQALRFDLVLQMQGNGLVTNSLAVLLGSRAVAGFYLPGLHCPDPTRFVAYPSDRPEVWRHLQLAEHLGAPALGTGLDLRLLDEDVEEGETLLQDLGLGTGGFAVVHPGATAAARRWSPDGFAEVAKRLHQRGVTPLVTGVRAEADITAAVAVRAGPEALDLTGRTSLGGLAHLVSRARLVVTNDTGVSHLAAAVRTPSVVVFAGSLLTGSDPARWAPLDTRLHRSCFVPENHVQQSCAPSPLEPCLRDACSLPQREAQLRGRTGPAEVSLESVWAEVEALLDQAR
jgi:ADP-heptose:LPS heptosyltransferase